MPKSQIVYMKKKISVVDVHNQRHLFIDGEHIRTAADRKAGPYWAIHLPYQRFDSLHDLGKAIVDYRAMDKKKKKGKKA